MATLSDWRFSGQYIHLLGFRKFVDKHSYKRFWGKQKDVPQKSSYSTTRQNSAVNPEKATDENMAHALWMLDNLGYRHIQNTWYDIYYVIWCDIWYDVIRYMMWFDAIWYGIWYMTWYDMMIWCYDMILYDIWYDTFVNCN